MLEGLARVLSCLAAARTASTAAAAAAATRRMSSMAACSDRLRAATTGAAEGWHPQLLLSSSVCCRAEPARIAQLSSQSVACHSQQACPLLCRAAARLLCCGSTAAAIDIMQRPGGPPAELRGGGVSTNPYQRKIRCFHLAVCRLRSSAENSPLQSPHPQENQQLSSAA